MIFFELSSFCVIVFLCVFLKNTIVHIYIYKISFLFCLLLFGLFFVTFCGILCRYIYIERERDDILVILLPSLVCRKTDKRNTHTLTHACTHTHLVSFQDGLLKTKALPNK